MRRLVLLAFLVLAALPSEATACAISPDGVSVGGSCWFLGEPNQSCDEVCDLRGLNYSVATRTFAGSDGSISNCREVLTALGADWSTGGDATCSSGLGCTFDGANAVRCTTPTTSSASSGLQRACACTAPQTAPTLSSWGMAALVVALFGFGALAARRRSRI